MELQKKHNPLRGAPTAEPCRTIGQTSRVLNRFLTMTRRQNIRDLYEMQQRALELLRGGMTQQQVAALIGVSDRTVRRWVQNPISLDQVLAENRVQISDYVPPNSQNSEPLAPLEPASLENLSFEDQVDRLLQLSLEGLNRILTNPELSPRDFLNACRTVRELKRDSLTVWVNPAMAISANEEEGDFDLALRVLREALLSPNSNSRSIQGALGMIKMLQAKAELPQSVLSGKDEMESAELQQDIKSMSVDQLMAEYRGIIIGR